MASACPLCQAIKKKYLDLGVDTRTGKTGLDMGICYKKVISSHRVCRGKQDEFRYGHLSSDIVEFTVGHKICFGTDIYHLMYSGLT